jgi:AhpD family alkylhydroperoxidase
VKFSRRTYNSPAELLADFRFVLRTGKQLKRAREKGLVAPPFRERLMLAVTAVHGCRYCSWAHARQALKSGIDRKEMAELLCGSVEECPEEEVVAVLFAQHWAETNANPDPEAVHKLRETYGEEKARTIDVLLRMIRLGNLCGNSFDYLLYRLSFGRWGN